MLTPLPRRLKGFQKEAEEWLAQGRVKDCDFSGGTYQILVDDPILIHEEWAFIQLDEQGRLKDSFCSCKDSEEQQVCIHQAIAYLYIYHGHDSPLHKRFVHSLWNFLFKQCAEEFGTEAGALKKVGSGHFIRSVRGKHLISIQAHNPEAATRLEKMILEREYVTEENSLKFSNLSAEEILEWERGRPSPQLAYDLSFWSDLARWLMEMQEKEYAYSIHFEEIVRKLPAKIEIRFPGLVIERALSKELLEGMIPSLSTVNSPLKVHDAWKESIEKITYDKVKGCFIIALRKHQTGLNHRLEKLNAIAFGEWAYVYGDGFYSKQTHFFNNIVEYTDVEEALQNHAQDIKKFLQGAVVKEKPHALSYNATFDDKWNLHIYSYLFHLGDLVTPYSKCFQGWAYIEDQGFYRLEKRDFTEAERIIPQDEVADFVSENRPWLNSLPGYKTHLSSLEATVSYQLDDHTLTFTRQAAHEKTRSVSKDFGRWIYVEGQGFFAKRMSHSGMPFKGGTHIPLEQISSFIKYNKDDLQVIPGFFSTKCPVEKSELSMHLDGHDEIVITPKFTLTTEYKGKNVRFFDEITYVEGEGFYILPPDKRLPEGFSTEVIVQERDISDFIAFKLPKLLPITSSIDQRLIRPAEKRLVSQEIEKMEQKGKEGFGVKLNYQTEHGTISVSALWDAFRKNKRYAFTEAGLFDLNDEQFHWIRNLKRGGVDLKKRRLNLSTLELMRLNAVEGIISDPKGGKPALHAMQVLRDITEMRIPEDPDLTGLKSNLRPYQTVGVHWLWFLYHHGLSGLLCDDMGLGKTHQTMALMAAIINEVKKNPGSTKKHFLIVCPTSVIYHWQEKLQQFLPEMKVWTFHGIKRSLSEFFESSDILLTSYGVWRNEIDSLSKMHFEVAIFDELQIAKNHTSRIYKALLKSKAKMRLGLTGTPIENRLRELKTIFDIILPTYMPLENDYRETFVRPIERDFNQERKLLLSRLIKPFVMRRKKQDVLLDLPEKTEEISHCDLKPEQAKLYADVLVGSRDRLIKELEDESNPVPYLHIFALLSQLKQVCNHPASYLKKPQDYKDYESGKWDLFLELLEEARESKQKVVVFSHYLTMLDIIELHLKSHHIGYASIRGSTSNRGQQLQRFNDDPNCEVFVASLQAVGLGVDLTAASVVIHYDRWWNAARENQATDRVHRIGQTRGVQVFKLMTVGTLEEHIDFLINKKSRLMEEVVTVDDQELVKKFDRSEMISLLQMLPKI